MNVTQDLESLLCATCFMTFAVPELFVKKRRQDGAHFYCPSGHSNYFGDGEIDRLRKQRDAALSRETLERDQRLAAELERDKLKKRASKGTCPCCKRHFRELQRHMETKHPDYSKK